MRTNYRNLTGTYYLNNSGHRWVNFTNGEKDQTKVLFPDGHIENRTILYYESFGNFAVCCISLKGKKLTSFQDSIYLPDGSEFIGIILKDSDFNR